MKFKDFLEEADTLAKLEDLLQDKFVQFMDSLSSYIDYNDKESAKELEDVLPILEKVGVITSNNKLFRIARLQSKTDYKTDYSTVTSATTKLPTGDMLQDFKDMIDQYTKKGDYYLVNITKAKGLDVNKFSKIFKGKLKELRKKYNEGHLDSVGALFDTFKDKKYQNEFIIFGSYEVKSIEPIE